MAKFEMRIKMIATIQDLYDLMKFHHSFDEDDIFALKLKVYNLGQTPEYAKNVKAQRALEYVRLALANGPSFKFSPPSFTEANKAIEVNTMSKPVIPDISGQEIKIHTEKLQISIDLSKLNCEDLLEEVESQLIIEVWYMCCFNMTLTSRKLGISTKGLYTKIRKIYDQRGIDFFLRDTNCGVRGFDARAYVTQLTSSFFTTDRTLTRPEQVSS